jgi:anti-anti-sigma regulatory factor
MAYRITQSEDAQNGKMILLLEGSFEGEGGQKIEQVCQEALKRFGNNIIIDVSGVTFLDESSSNVLCRLRNHQGLSIVGCHLFTKKCIDQSESK